MSYTQGKWELRGNRIFVEGTYKAIADVMVQKNYEDVTFKPIEDVEANANAKLIAASPELLKACQWALEQFTRLADEGHYPEFMLQENGGVGLMPLVEAIELATK